MITLLNYQTFDSPWGKMIGAGTSSHLYLFIHKSAWAETISKWERKGYGFQKGQNKTLDKVRVEFRKYVDKKPYSFKSIEFKFSGTDFQEKAWRALCKVEHGSCITYADQARMIKNDSAVRAIGNANRMNPICILVPCHRVIGSSGSLTGYAYGIKMKKDLLSHEGIKIP